MRKVKADAKRFGIVNVQELRDAVHDVKRYESQLADEIATYKSQIHTAPPSLSMCKPPAQ